MSKIGLQSKFKKIKERIAEEMGEPASYHTGRYTDHRFEVLEKSLLELIEEEVSSLILPKQNANK